MHTPGPWRVEQTYRMGGPAPHAIYADGEKLAILEDLDDYSATQANARLIAAAPELLEACKSMLRLASKAIYAEISEMHPEVQDGARDGAVAQIEEWEAAIAKASALNSR